MAEFTIEIAGHSAQIVSLFESTREYCKRYLTEKEPELQITVCREDLAFEQEMSEEEARREGIRIRKFPEPFLERASMQRALAEFLLAHNTLLFHGSAVAVDDRGYVFTASCGTGKSTHTRLWCQAFGNRAVMVNDDKPFLQITESGIWVCGSPWSGKHGLDTNITVPLAGICILQRGAENRISSCYPEAALPMLRHQSYCPLDERKRPIFETLVKRLAERVPLWQMECNKDPEAALVAHGAMSEYTAHRICVRKEKGPLV